MFPSPRIDDLLDQLGKASYFSMLDLVSGYMQVMLHLTSQEKTAFTTHQDLHVFYVMPFGLMNGPTVFQRLMQQMLVGLNPNDDTDFMSVDIDHIPYSWKISCGVYFCLFSWLASNHEQEICKIFTAIHFPVIHFHTYMYLQPQNLDPRIIFVRYLLGLHKLMSLI